MESTVHSAEALSVENQTLRVQNEVLGQRLRAAEDETVLYRDKLAGLNHELAQLKRLIFGTKSERFVPVGGPDQLPRGSALERCARYRRST